MFNDDLGINYFVDTYQNIISQDPPAPRGTLFFAMDTEQLLISEGVGCDSDSDFCLKQSCGLMANDGGGAGQYEFVESERPTIIALQDTALLTKGDKYLISKVGVMGAENVLIFDLDGNSLGWSGGNTRGIDWEVVECRDGKYTILNTEQLNYYCASGFSGGFEAVNGSYALVRDPQGNALIYNNYPYYQNDENVTLFYSGTNWAFDLTENNEIASDFIEKPEDSTTPEGNYYISGQSSFYGTVVEGQCPDTSSSSSSKVVVQVDAGEEVTISDNESQTYALNVEVGDSANFTVASGGSFKITAGNGDVIAVDPDGVWDGPFYLSLGDECFINLNGEIFSVKYTASGSFILVIGAVQFIVYRRA